MMLKRSIINKEGYLYKFSLNYVKDINIKMNNGIKNHYLSEYNNKGTKLQRINFYQIPPKN